MLIQIRSFSKAGLKKHGINPKDLADIEKNNPELWDKITKKPDGIRDRAKQLTQKQKAFMKLVDWE